MSFSILIYKNYAKPTNFCKNCCEWRNRTPSSPLWWSLLVKLLPGFMSEIVCLLFYCATITLTRNIIPHYRWRISHATLPISSNYELDNGLVASARFLMYTHLGTGGRIWTYDPRVTSHKLFCCSFPWRETLYVALPGWATPAKLLGKEESNLRQRHPKLKRTAVHFLVRKLKIRRAATTPFPKTMISRATDRTWTRNLEFGGLTIYQLIYCRIVTFYA